MSAGVWQVAAAGAVCALALAALIWQRRALLDLARRSPLALSAALGAAAALAWIAGRAARLPPAAQLPPTSPPVPVPDRDALPTPPARPIPHEVDHAHDLPIDTVPDARAPIIPPGDDPHDVVRRLEQRARRRRSSSE